MMKTFLPLTQCLNFDIQYIIGFVSFFVFNGISISEECLMLKTSLQKNSSGTIKSIIQGIWSFNDISRKINVIVPPEFVLMYYDLAVQHFSHYAMGTLRFGFN